jgi:hypothetical protein
METLSRTPYCLFILKATTSVNVAHHPQSRDPTYAWWIASSVEALHNVHLVVDRFLCADIFLSFDTSWNNLGKK